MEWLFLVVSFVAVFAAGMMLTRQNAVHSALFLILNFGCVAFLYLMLDAPFLAMVQLAVYAGAIMVLFLFVIMLLGAEITTDTSGQLRWLSLVGAGVAGLVLLIFGFPVASDLLSEEGLEPRVGTAYVRVINAVPGGDVAEYFFPAGDEVFPLETDAVAASVTFDGTDETVEDITLDNVIYDDSRDSVQGYTTLTSGEYTVNVGVGDGELEPFPIYSESITLEPDDVRTVVLYENSNGILDAELLEDDLSPTDAGEMRLKLFNAVSGTAVSLIDIGQYRSISTLCEDDSCATLLPHRPLTEEPLPFAETTTIDIEEGMYNLAFINDEYDVLRILEEYEAERGVVETRVFVLEPGVLGGQPSYRAAVFSAVASPSFGSPEAIGQILFIDYLLPVQLVGILLLVALIGVIVLARPDALAQAERRRINRRRRVSRPLVSVISQQTGADVLSGEYQAKLTEGSDDDDPQDS